MTSIRKKLIATILSALVFFALLVGGATYWSVHAELDELYDKNMEQVATVLAGTGLEDDSFTTRFSSDQKTLHGEEEFLIQIWRNDMPAYSSHPAIKFPLQSRSGYGTIVFQDGDWRFYRLQDKDTIIQVAQDLRIRHSVIAEIYRIFLLPFIILLPLLAGVIWLLIGYGMRPLARISSLIERRTASFLDPLPGGEVPAEISTLVHALNDLLRRLQDALAAQRRFTADAAHELRTPLAAVRLQLDILKRAATGAERDAALDTLDKGVARSVRLVEQLLELARQEPDYAEFSFAPVALNDVIGDAIDPVRPLAAAKGITLAADLEENLMVMGHPPQLGIMIGNIVSNAVLYTPAGGHVHITARDRQTHIQLNIADDGIGIAPEERERVFDRFYRVAGTEPVGSGLGLSIVRNIAAAHGIGISLADGLNSRGVTFRLTIPKMA